jgi:hypothetical protein
MIDLVTEHERDRLAELLAAPTLDADAVQTLLLERADRIMADAREQIRRKPFGPVILALLDFELWATRRWWKIRDGVARRRYSARH